MGHSREGARFSLLLLAAAGAPVRAALANGAALWGEGGRVLADRQRRRAQSREAGGASAILGAGRAGGGAVAPRWPPRRAGRVALRQDGAARPAGGGAGSGS